MTDLRESYPDVSCLSTASKAIDALLDSKFAAGSNAIFSDRESVIEFLGQMLIHKFFHRAQKVIVQKIEEKKKTGKKSKSDVEVETEGEDSKKEKKSKKKVKLDMHLQQVIVDGSEPYVWIYDPIPLKTWFIGLGLVVGAVLICLFPLWPKIVRTYVYYLSIAAAGFLFFIIGLAVLRFIVFCIAWAMTLGKHHFWILPNLTEDVGFFASFWPLYMHEFKGTSDVETDKASSKSHKESSSPSKKNKTEEKKPLLSKEEEEDQEEDSSVSQGESNPSEVDKNGSENGFEILETQEDLEADTSHPKSS